MKRLISCLPIFLFLFLCKSVNAQTGHDYQLIGSFVFNNTVFNYTYKQSANGTSSFTVEQVTGKKVNINDIHQRLINIGAQSKALHMPDSFNKSIDSIDNSITDGFDKLKNAGSALDSLIKVYNNAAHDSLKSAPKDTSKRLISNSIITLTNNLSKIMDQLPLMKPVDESIFSDFTISTFKTALPGQLSKYVEDSLTTKMRDEIDKIADDKFIEIKARAKFDDDEPSTAYLKLLSEHINVYFDVYNPVNYTKMGKLLNNMRLFFGDNQNDKNKNNLVLISMKVENVQLEFEAGTIKNIYAEFSSIDDPQKKYLFQNTIPISISGKFAAVSLPKNRIFALNGKEIKRDYKKDIDDYLSRNSPSHLKSEDVSNTAYFNLGELMQYILILENHKEDYSPDDKVYNLSPLQPSVELKKQKRSKILTLKAFSDFNGISGDKPNGLLQFEGSIHTNISTYRWQIKRWNIGVFTSSDLLGSLNKIDNNNKYLIATENNLDSRALVDNKKVFQIQPIDMFRYQITGVTLNTNIFKFAMPDFGLTFNTNVGYGLMLTAVSDSLIVKNNTYIKSSSPYQRSISSTNFNIYQGIEFSPDGRYGFNVSFAWNWLNINDDEFKRTDNLKSQIQTLEFGGFISTNSDSKLFFRWRKNSQIGDLKINYNQIQVGYLVDVFKQAK